MKIRIPFTKSFLSVGGGFWGLGSYAGMPYIEEPYTGAWQQNAIVPDGRQELTAFSAVYACIAMIAEDIAKLRMQLVEQNEQTEVWTQVRSNSPFALLLMRRPNDYQVWQQFFTSWLVWKLMWGNAYVYIVRDERGVPKSMHVLDPRRTSVRVNQATGDVFYALNADPLAELTEVDTVVPARFIMHDRCVTLWHPLVGVSPIYACALSVMQGRMIQKNSAKFFQNMARPSGQLTAPGTITDETAKRLKAQFETMIAGDSIGRLLVAGDGLKYEAMPPMPAADAQLIEQLEWTAVDVARCFKMPPYKIGAAQEPKFANYAQMTLDYYTQTLQVHIESIEALMDEGFGLWGVPGHIYETRFNLDGLLRMDPLSRAERNKEGVTGGWLAPNEARRSENLPPVDGGDTPYMQQQNFALDKLADRSPTAPQPALPAPAPAAPSTPAKAVFEAPEVRGYLDELADLEFAEAA